MKLKTQNLWTAGIMLLLSGVVLVGTWGLPYWTDSVPGPSFLPVWIAAVGAVLAVLLGLSKEESQPATGEMPATAPESSGNRWTAIFTIGALCGAVAALPFLGLGVAGALFMLIMLKGVLKRSLLSSLAATAIAVTLVYVVFVYWLDIRIPATLFARH